MTYKIKSKIIDAGLTVMLGVMLILVYYNSVNSHGSDVTPFLCTIMGIIAAFEIKKISDGRFKGYFVLLIPVFNFAAGIFIFAFRIKQYAVDETNFLNKVNVFFANHSSIASTVLYIVVLLLSVIIPLVYLAVKSNPKSDVFHS